VVDPNEVFGVAGVQTGAVGVRRCGNQQIHDPCTRLSTNARNCCRELAIAGRDIVIDGERVERPLQQREPSQSFCPDRWVSSDQDAEVQLGERRSTDG